MVLRASGFAGIEPEKGRAEVEIGGARRGSLPTSDRSSGAKERAGQRLFNGHGGTAVLARGARGVEVVGTCVLGIVGMWATVAARWG